MTQRNPELDLVLEMKNYRIMDINNKGVLKQKGDILFVDTSVWMRPKTACERLAERGFDVSYSLMNYWKNEGKIKSKTIKSLDNLTLVNIETVPEDMRVKTPIK